MHFLRHEQRVYPDRSPEDLMFVLAEAEWNSLRSQFATSNGRGGRRYPPRCFSPTSKMVNDTGKFRIYLRSSAFLCGSSCFLSAVERSIPMPHLARVGDLRALLGKCTETHFDASLTR